MNNYALYKPTRVKPRMSALPPALIVRRDGVPLHFGNGVPVSQLHAYPVGAAGIQVRLSSVPRFIWPVLAPFELSIAAPLCHDCLYSCNGESPPSNSAQNFTRLETDTLFYNLMITEGVVACRAGAACRTARIVDLAALRRDLEQKIEPVVAFNRYIDVGDGTVC